MRIYKIKHSVYTILTVILLIAAAPDTVWGELAVATQGAERLIRGEDMPLWKGEAQPESEETQPDSVKVQPQAEEAQPQAGEAQPRSKETQFQKSERLLGEEKELGTNGSLHITRTLKAVDLEQLEAPSGAYQDEDGTEYKLDHWQIKEIPGSEVKKRMEKQIVYAGVEGAEELPESIAVEEEATGVPAEGELAVRVSRVLKEAWHDGFSVPVTFHSYGADEYEVGSLVLSGGKDLNYTDALGGELLSILGLSSEEYRFHAIEWAGEPYVDDRGQTCRKAMASGQKLLRDYEITYEGEVSWIEPVSYQLEMIYRPALLNRIPPETAALPLPAHEAEPEPEPGPLWYWVRSGFVITVAAGLIGIFLGIILLLVCRRRRRRESSRGCLSEMMD